MIEVLFLFYQCRSDHHSTLQIRLNVGRIDYSDLIIYLLILSFIHDRETSNEIGDYVQINDCLITSSKTHYANMHSYKEVYAILHSGC